jgi:uncharacterized damage-inducible protein DinB
MAVSMTSIHADHIRHLYEYHFTLNRRFWHFCLDNLTWNEMIKRSDISVGSIRNQFVHIMSVDERWFSGLRRLEVPDYANPEAYEKPEELRMQWDIIEADMRVYLDGLIDDDLEKPFENSMKVWHVLSHVVNHGTAHRAQIGAMLRHLGLKPPPQDYILYVMGKI